MHALLAFALSEVARKNGGVEEPSGLLSNRPTLDIDQHTSMRATRVSELDSKLLAILIFGCELVRRGGAEGVKETGRIRGMKIGERQEGWLPIPLDEKASCSIGSVAPGLGPCGFESHVCMRMMSRGQGMQEERRRPSERPRTILAAPLGTPRATSYPAVSDLPAPAWTGCHPSTEQVHRATTTPAHPASAATRSRSKEEHHGSAAGYPAVPPAACP